MRFPTKQRMVDILNLMNSRFSRNFVTSTERRAERDREEGRILGLI